MNANVTYSSRSARRRRPVETISGALVLNTSLFLLDFEDVSLFLLDFEAVPKISTESERTRESEEEEEDKQQQHGISVTERNTQGFRENTLKTYQYKQHVHQNQQTNKDQNNAKEKFVYTCCRNNDNAGRKRLHPSSAWKND